MTEAVKHTPGPWLAHGGLLGHKGDVFAPTAKSVKDCHHIARCFAPKPAKPIICELQAIQITRDAIRISEANARLIAAAPDLLEALRDLCDAWEVPGEGYGGGKFKGNVTAAYKAARAAIRKAEGTE